MVTFNVVQTVSDQVYFAPSAHPLVVVNSTFASLRLPWKAVCPNAELFLLSGDRNGVHQISTLLKDRKDISSLHLVSHGYAGGIGLGTADLNLQTLKQYVDPLRVWATALYDGFAQGGHSLRTDGNPPLYLYNTRTGVGDAGLEFIERLHQITGLRVVIPQMTASRLYDHWEASNLGNRSLPY